MGKIIFRVYKYIQGGRRERENFGFQPRSFIKFNNETIGHIIGNDVYFYIRSNEDPCLNYKPELWRSFKDHLEARQEVIRLAETIWKTLDIYHPLKNIQPNYGLW